MFMNWKGLPHGPKDVDGWLWSGIESKKKPICVSNGSLSPQEIPKSLPDRHPVNCGSASGRISPLTVKLFVSTFGALASEGEKLVGSDSIAHG